MIKHFIIPISLLIVCMISLPGCSYYADKERQTALEAALNTYLFTQQTPPAKTSPAQYSVCNSIIYPCQLITPLNMGTSIYHTELSAINDQGKNTYQKNNIQQPHSHKS